MKNHLTLLVFISTLLLIQNGCDKIEQPVVDQGDVVMLSGPNPLESMNTAQDRKILLEDYTGHQCINCPAAALIAEDIHADNPDRVIVVSVHAPDGAFQEVSDSYPRDFTTEAGSEYASALAIGGNPQGTFNRIPGGTFDGAYWALPSDWESFATSLLSDFPLADVALQQEIVLNSDETEIELKVYGKFFNEFSGDLRLINLLIQDVVVSPQTASGGTDVDYEHHHVLAGVIGGTWGTVIDEDGLMSTDDLFGYGFNFELPDADVDTTFSVDNLSVVSFVCDRDDLEIYQAQIIHVQ